MNLRNLLNMTSKLGAKKGWLIATGTFGVSALIYTSVVISQTVLPPLIDLPSDPLYMNGSKTKANLTLALSVEFPTVGQTYRDEFDKTKTYIGYFDNMSCYKHVPGSGSLGAYFDWTGAVNASGSCGGGGFNGNFMNWATSSAIDIMRYGLTGGNRVVDEGTGNGRTVVERAWLPDTFYRSTSYFSEKKLPKELVSQMIETSVANKIGNNDMYIYNCRDRVYFAKSADTTGGCTNPFGVADAKSDQLAGPTNNDTYYEVRNLVCDANSAQNRLMSYDKDTKKWRGLCLRYSDGKGKGHYKPVGQFQVNAESMRIGVFGYLQDNQRKRYGGVLRAPLKYLGARQFDKDFNLMTAPNPYAEWDATTGVFIDNPQQSSVQYGDQGHPRSGAIMYINKFGTLDSNNVGSYKGLDPLSELYYESIRYLQGKQPTSNAVDISGTAAQVRVLKEDFPVYSKWEDPFAGFKDATGTGKSCLRNSVLTIADVFTHSDRSLPGNTITTNEDFARANETGPALDVPFWTNIVGSFEANGTRNYTDSEGRSQTASNISQNSPYEPTLLDAATKATGATGGSYYMAGLAYWANTQSFRPDQPKARVTTYTIDVNERRSSDSLSFRKQQQLYLAAKYGGFDDHLADNTGNPYAKDNNILWLGSDGDPKNYFIVSDAQKFLDSLADIFADIVEETGSIAGGAISSQRLTSAQDESVYQARFNPEANYWSGRLLKYALSLSSDQKTVVIADKPEWEAAAVMTAAAKTDHGASRNIIIGPPLGRQGVDDPAEFKWDSLPTAHQDAFSTGLSDIVDTLGPDRIQYIRGDRRKEQSATLPNAPFRNRDYVLGSIVNSGLIYQGPPSTSIGGDDYLDFYNDNKSRAPVVFANANDGMLHAFYAKDGKEAFAYVPGFIAPRLRALPDLDYSHRSLVDATPAVSEAYVSGKWRSVLVSGLGGGGQGLFALDVTDPANFDKNDVLWEFTDKDHPAMGNILGRPEIFKIRTTPKSSSSAPSYKWYAVVASGVNNYASDGSAHATGDPSIFILDLSAKPTPSSPWAEGKNFWRIELPQGSTAIAKGVMGLRGVKSFYAGALDSLYTGDLQGNLWKISFKDYGIDDLSVDAGGNLTKLNSIEATKSAMFIAKSSDSKLQPITTSPSVMTGFGGKPIVLLGTGKYLETNDLGIPLPTTASFYALLDESKVIAGRSSLVEASIDGSTGVVTTADFVWGSTSPAKQGWFMDFDQSLGERQISEITVLGGQLYFGTIYPTKGACGEGGGNFYKMNALTGDGKFIESPVGLLAAPIIISIGNASLSDSDTTGQRTATQKYAIILQGSKGMEIDPSGGSVITYKTGRISWRQINNFRENAK